VVASPIVFIVAIVTLVGWLIFSVFAGVGMVSLPYDWLNEFKHRPKPITKAEYEEKKRQVGEQSSILMSEYKAIREDYKAAGRSNNFSKRYRKVKNKENRFRKVLIIEFRMLLFSSITTKCLKTVTGFKAEI
jgi:LMBR1 domain-containing protein 1